MYWTRVKLVAVVLLLAGLGGTGATLLSIRKSTAEPPNDPAPTAALLPSQPDGRGAGSTAIKQPNNTAKIVADKELSRRNLHELAVAMQNYADTFKSLMPAPATYGKDGKALLSWRVELLPFLGEGRLYSQFKRDEPWDSAHNKKLLSKMPKVFAPPGVATQQPYTTFYQVFVSAGAGKGGAAIGNAAMPGGALLPAAGGAGGPGGSGALLPYNGITAAFVKGQRVRFPPHFTDGTSNTILIVEAGHAVPWTKPEDLHYAKDEPLPELGGLFADVFHAVCADGAVHTLTKRYDEASLRAAITSNAGDLFEWTKIEAAGQANADRRRPLPGDGERMRALQSINDKLAREAERTRAERNRLLDEKQKILEEMLQEVKRSRGPVQKKGS